MQILNNILRLRLAIVVLKKLLLDSGYINELTYPAWTKLSFSWSGNTRCFFVSTYNTGFNQHLREHPAHSLGAFTRLNNINSDNWIRKDFFLSLYQRFCHGFSSVLWILFELSLAAALVPEKYKDIYYLSLYYVWYVQCTYCKFLTFLVKRGNLRFIVVSEISLRAK